MMASRSYAYVLLLASIAAAAVRFTRNFRSAEIQSLRLKEPRVRLTQKFLALVVLTGAAALTFLSLTDMSWLWIAAAVAWLSGSQSLLVLFLNSPRQIVLIERIFGTLFLGVAVMVYMMFVR